MSPPTLTVFLDIISPFAYMAFYVTKVGGLYLAVYPPEMSQMGTFVIYEHVPVVTMFLNVATASPIGPCIIASASSCSINRVAKFDQC